MYPVLDYYNKTAVITWTEDVVTYSHLMLPVIMAGIVLIVAFVYGLLNAPKGIRHLTYSGIAVMALAMLAAVIYIISGVGNYSIPTLFSSGPSDINWLAMNCEITGIIGWGSFLS
jgi:hypothetical protein